MNKTITTVQMNKKNASNGANDKATDSLLHHIKASLNERVSRIRDPRYRDQLVAANREFCGDLPLSSIGKTLENATA